MLSLSLNLTFIMVLGASRVSGDVVLVEDLTGQPHDPAANPASVDLALCAFGARGLYAVKPDAYDAVVTFTTHPMTGLEYALTGTTPAGYAVRQSDRGVAYGGFLIRQPPSAYGSAAALKHCVYLGPLRQWPADPDASFELPAGPFGGTMPSGVTGIEVLGHEFGHHWLMFAAHDAADGRGLQALFRADPRDPDQSEVPKVSAATLHYSHYADSRSVMYGNFITPLGGGMFRLEGGARKYGPLDQYLMGLRSPAETPPLLVLDDGSGRGLVGAPLAKGESQVVSGARVDIPVDDVIRALGPRVPAYPDAQRCFRVAFVLIQHPGHVATAQELALVDAYRRRWEQWFTFATDGRGSVETRLDAPDACRAEPAREGAVEGAPLPPGSVEAEAAPAPVELPAPPVEDEPELARLKPGCGCGSGAGVAWLPVLVFFTRAGTRAFATRREPRRRPSA